MNNNTQVFPCVCLHDEPEQIYPNEPDKWRRYANQTCEHCEGLGYVEIDSSLELFTDMAHAQEVGIPDMEWIIPDIIPGQGRYSTVYAEPKHGKSLLGQWWAFEAAGQNKRVWYIDNEMTTEDTVDRANGWGMKFREFPTLKWSQHTVPDIIESASMIVERAKEEFDWVIVDTMRSSMRLAEGSSDELVDFQKEIVQPLKKNKITLTTFDHVPKGNIDAGPRGSGHKLAITDVNWSLEKEEQLGGGMRLILDSRRHGARIKVKDTITYKVHYPIGLERIETGIRLLKDE